MKRCWLISTVCLLVWFATPAEAQTPQRKASLSYGVEWGYTSTLMHVYHHNYIADEGYRVDINGIEACYNSNGQILGHIGVNAWDRYTFSVYSGYIGIKQERHVIPLTVRATYFFRSYHEDGYMAFIENGIGIHDEAHNTYLGKFGTGYRLSLSPKLNMDLMLSLQLADDHPTLYDPEDQEIPKEDLRRNDSTYGAINFMIAITF